MGKKNDKYKEEKNPCLSILNSSKKPCLTRINPSLLVKKKIKKNMESIYDILHCGNARTNPEEKDINPSPVDVDDDDYFLSTFSDDTSFTNRLTLKEMPGDSSCMFHAIACSIYFKFKSSAAEIREIVASYITRNKNVISQKSALTLDDLKRHVTNVRYSNTYGESLDLFVLASIFNLTIKVYNAAQNTCIMFKPTIGLENSYGLVHSFAYLYFRDYHYNVYI